MSEELIARVAAIIAETQRMPLESVALDSSLAELGIDSMDAMNVVFQLEEEFDIDIPDERVREIRTVRHIVEGVESLLKAKECAGSQSQASA
jgi:acyl carrier protein